MPNRSDSPIHTEQPAMVQSGTAAPVYKRIAYLAYSYCETRGYQRGSPEEDMPRAEEELSGNQGQRTDAILSG